MRAPKRKMNYIESQHQLALRLEPGMTTSLKKTLGEPDEFRAQQYYECRDIPEFVFTDELDRSRQSNILKSKHILQHISNEPDTGKMLSGDEVQPHGIAKRQDANVDAHLLLRVRESRELGHAQTFPFFPLLPCEIRFIIWKIALPESRVVRLDLDGNINPKSRPVNSRMGYPKGNRFTAAIRNPILLSACPESRQVALEHYRPVFHAHANSIRETTYFDFETDVLYFNAAILASGMSYFQNVFNAPTRKKFRNIAFPLTEFNVVMPRLSMFTGRTKLFMMLDGFGNEFQNVEEQLYLGEIDLKKPIEIALGGEEQNQGEKRAGSETQTEASPIQWMVVSDLQDQEIDHFRRSFENKKRVYPKWPAPDLVFATLENTTVRTAGGLVRWYD